MIATVAKLIASVLFAVSLAASAQDVDRIECGCCGAHVSEWWYVQDSEGEPTEVCHDCYVLLTREDRW